MKTQPSASGFPWGMVIAIFLFALVGLALIAYASYVFLFQGPASPPSTPVALSQATATVSAVTPTDLTPLPASTPTTGLPTETPPPTDTPTPVAPVFTTIKPANIRSGPGTVYPVIGGMPAGQTAKVIGRDSSTRWFVIESDSSLNGQGWVSDQVATYNGDVNALSVIAAPPTPLPTATPIPPTPTPKPTPSSKHGLTGQLTLCDPKQAYVAVIERICFRELIHNTTASQVTYGALGVLALNLNGGPNQFQTSWSGDLAIDPGCYGPTNKCGGIWEDGMKIKTPDSYRLLLQICYSKLNDCGNGASDWETLAAVDVLVVS